MATCNLELQRKVMAAARQGTTWLTTRFCGMLLRHFIAVAAGLALIVAYLRLSIKRLYWATRAQVRAGGITDPQVCELCKSPVEPRAQTEGAMDEIRRSPNANEPERWFETRHDIIVSTELTRGQKYLALEQDVTLHQALIRRMDVRKAEVAP